MSVVQDTDRPVESDTGIAFLIYILYAIGYFTGISAIVGVIIAHAHAGTADPLLRSHYQFQIRTFWIGLLYLVVEIITCVIIVGIFVLFWWFVWSVVRILKGVLALNDQKPIANPGSWMFG